MVKLVKKGSQIAERFEKVKPKSDPLDDILIGTGFDFSVKDVQPSMILSIEGQDKAGKTHLALTAPGPIAYQGVDFGHDGVVQKFQRAGKKVAVATYAYETDPALKGKDDIAAQGEYIREHTWKKFKTDYEKVVDSGKFKTVVWDTATEVWEILRLAHFGKLERIPMLAYVEINAVYKEMIRKAKDQGINLILLHQVKKEYETYMKDTPQGPKEQSRETGRWIRAGMNKVSYLVDAYVESRFVPPVFKTEKRVRTQLAPGRFETEVLRARHAPHTVGLTLPEATFKDLAMLIQPDVPEEAWGQDVGPVGTDLDLGEV